MNEDYPRPLDSKDKIEHFICNVLKFDAKKFRGLINKIYLSEIGVDKVKIHKQTSVYTDLRDRKFADDLSRWDLREKIINELFTLTRLEDDEKIKFKRGGALPLTKLKCEKKAFIVIGLPASGKSNIATRVADEYGAVIVDSDYAKRKLPEYKDAGYGAAVVHEESSNIMFGFEKNNNPRNLMSLFELALKEGYNLVIPRVGAESPSLIKLAKALKEQNDYEVHLILIDIPKREATIRAIMRFKKTKRYVPLGLIFDGYGNDPSLSYYYIRSIHNNVFNSFGCLSNDVPMGNAPKVIDIVGKSPVRLYNIVEKK